MARIDDLTAVTSLAANDQILVADTSAGETARATLATLTAYLQSALTASPRRDSYSPLTGQTLTVPFTAGNVWLVITPAGTIAALTVALTGTFTDGMEITLNTSQTITALTITTTSGSLQGSPTTLAANGFASLRYDAGTNTWRRVG